MRLLLTILSVILTIIGLILSILPFGYIALIPIITALIISFIAFKLFQKEGKNTTIFKVLFAVIIISLGLTIYNSLKPNEIVVDQETLEQEKKSEEQTLEELEGIEIDD